MTTVALVLSMLAAPTSESGREPVLLDFHSQSCGPCIQMRPAIAQLRAKGYPVRSYDLGQSPEMAERYGISSVPTFIIVDAKGQPLARTQGLQPAGELATLYRKAQAKLAASAPPPVQDEAPDPATAGAEADPGEGDAAAVVADAEADDRPAPEAPRAKPWETVVRIKVIGSGTIGYGSGTIIHSTPDEAIVLTCAHIFKIEGSRNQLPPSQFNRPIVIELFDGQPVQRGGGPATVHFAKEALRGQAIDYDFASDVGLIRVKTTRRLPSARVVPTNWTPRARMEMITVGCSEGRDATAWSTTISNPRAGLQFEGRPYEAIECNHAPKQGRSGGGLFTTDGDIAGVCDFAEPQHDKGLYASPRSIYRMLDRNKLMALYSPTRARDEALASRDRPPTRRAPADVVRAQSPDRAPERADTRITMPAPELLRIKKPAVARASDRPGARDRSSWHSAPALAVDDRQPGRSERRERPIPTEDQVAPAVDDDGFAPTTPVGPSEEAAPAPIRPGTPSRWRAVRSVPGD